jgi:hypothetical protein
MSGMERLFTEEQLEVITLEAQEKLEEYLGGIVIDGEATETSIITISKDKKLIFVEGNEYTGYGHLSDRHSYFSHKNYWNILDDGTSKLDNPTKFHPAMMPIVDYIKIAETIFIEENKNVTKNSRPDVFDKYSGYYNYSEGESLKYHLLTYKGTNIVHTLYPDKKKHNKKPRCRFGKGVVSTVLKFPEGTNDIIVPYENKDGVTAYSILFRKHYAERIEKLGIQRHDKEGKVIEQHFFSFRVFIDFTKYEYQDIMQLQYGDLSDFENIINQFDSEAEN